MEVEGNAFVNLKGRTDADLKKKPRRLVAEVFFWIYQLLRCVTQLDASLEAFPPRHGSS